MTCLEKEEIKCEEVGRDKQRYLNKHVVRRERERERGGGGKRGRGAGIEGKRDSASSFRI